MRAKALTKPGWWGKRGAKTAMTLALGSPDLVRDVVSVDNAPVDAAVEGQFARYVQGMKRIDAAGVTRQADADAILREYEPVSVAEWRLSVCVRERERCVYGC